ncbi:hypothetical protein [Spirosoma rhododendri]|uniref:Uncharacterized protein n=1 Tax=Spirosoma rhododendri TaxID=2728024 RepID=A0A7L5DY88_9BACT|nr:hypothetical protein [Spirosoma rhododendri]QJD81588.1 hypothetical protein HH216_24845 [Spirosoma rhododendri]
MGQTNDELTDSEYIRKVNARFRQLFPDTQTAPEADEDNHPKKYLSTKERSCWDPLQETSPELETFTEPHSYLINPNVSCQQFNHLLHQYKRAVFEVYQRQIAADDGATNSV